MEFGKVRHEIRDQVLSLFRDNEYKELRRSLTTALDKTSFTLGSNTLVQICNDTSTEKGLQNFWKIIKKSSVHSHPVTTWKFYIILHTIMLRGNASSILEIASNVAEISDPNKSDKIDKLNPCFATLNKEYAKYLLTKIHFHKTHLVVPSTLMVTLNDILIDAQYKSDVIMNFTCSIAAYANGLFELSRTVKTSLSQITEYPDIRAMPLPLLIDENHRFLYIIHDQMTHLHRNLPYEILQPQRNCFKRIFYETHLFHMDIKELNFKVLHPIPNIPEDIPKFHVPTNIYPVLPLLQPRPPPPSRHWEPVQNAVINHTVVNTAPQYHSTVNLSQSVTAPPTPTSRNQASTSSASVINAPNADSENPPSYSSLQRSHSTSSLDKARYNESF